MPSFRDRMAIRVIVWCIRHLPSRDTAAVIQADLELGSAVHSAVIAQVLEHDRQMRADT